MAKEKYYSMSLYAEKNGKPCSVSKLPQVVQDKNNSGKLNDLQVVGIDGENGFVEFFSQLPVSSGPCDGLRYLTRTQMERGEFLKVTRDLTDDDKCRALERIYSICASVGSISIRKK